MGISDKEDEQVAAEEYDPTLIARLESPERLDKLPPEKLLDLLELSGHEDLLDVGAGSGYFTFPAAARTSGTVYALDTHPQMLDMLKTRSEERGITNIRLIQGTAEQIPLGDESVDVMILSLILHIAEPHEQGLKEVQRVLKKGGKALCVEWAYPDSEPPSDHRISSSDMARMGEELGLKVLSRQPWSDKYYSIVFQK